MAEIFQESPLERIVNVNWGEKGTLLILKVDRVDGETYDNNEGPAPANFFVDIQNKLYVGVDDGTLVYSGPFVNAYAWYLDIELYSTMSRFDPYALILDASDGMVGLDDFAHVGRYATMTRTSDHRGRLVVNLSNLYDDFQRDARLLLSMDVYTQASLLSMRGPEPYSIDDPSKYTITCELWKEAEILIHGTYDDTLIDTVNIPYIYRVYDFVINGGEKIEGFLADNVELGLFTGTVGGAAGHKRATVQVAIGNRTASIQSVTWF